MFCWAAKQYTYGHWVLPKQRISKWSTRFVRAISFPRGCEHQLSIKIKYYLAFGQKVINWNEQSTAFRWTLFSFFHRWWDICWFLLIRYCCCLLGSFRHIHLTRLYRNAHNRINCYVMLHGKTVSEMAITRTTPMPMHISNKYVTIELFIIGHQNDGVRLVNF